MSDNRSVEYFTLYNILLAWKDIPQLIMYLYTVIPWLTSDPANKFFG